MSTSFSETRTCDRCGAKSEHDSERRRAGVPSHPDWTSADTFPYCGPVIARDLCPSCTERAFARPVEGQSNEPPGRGE